MSVYFPQAGLSLRVLWEDFGETQKSALQKTYSLPILARRVSVNINDYTQADTFEAEIDYKQFPFDPRTLRSCGVTIHMQNTGRIFLDDNSLNLIKPSRANTIFQGFADEESITFDDSKRTVKLEGRDFTSLFIDRKYLGSTLNLQARLDVVLDGILAQLPENQQASDNEKIKLSVRGIPLEDLPILGSFYSDKSEGSGVKNVKREETYWDVIQDVVKRAGLISYIELDELVLTKPRALYDEARSKIFVYGKNVSNLEFKRKLGRRRNFNVVVRSFSPETKEVLQAQIPAEATEEWSNETGIANQEVKMPQVGPDGQALPPDQLKAAPYLSFLIPDCNNKDQLVRIGQEIYEEIGRQQIEGSFQTKDMETTQIDDQSFDILKLRNGTPVQLSIDQGDLKGLYSLKVKKRDGTLDEKATEDSRARYLMVRGYDETVARVFAQTLDKFKKVFYTKGVRFTLDADNGFSAQVEFLNFIDTKLKPPGVP